jgi:hypothetical protein
MLNGAAGLVAVAALLAVLAWAVIWPPAGAREKAGIVLEPRLVLLASQRLPVCKLVDDLCKGAVNLCITWG